MEIKGNIGQEILISGIIKKIMVDENGLIQYSVRVFGSDLTIWLPSPDIVFKTASEVEGEEEIPEYLDDPKEDPKEDAAPVVKAAMKKRGRPRKATVEDLMKIANEVEKEES